LCIDISGFLYSLIEIVENALKSAVKAGKGRSDVADEAFATAEEKLDMYATHYHAREKFVSSVSYRTIEQDLYRPEVFSGTCIISLRLPLRRTGTKPCSLDSVYT